MAENFVRKTLDKLLEVVEVEFKIQLGVAEIKFPVTDHAKKWWINKKNRLELENAIQRAEEKFIEANKDQKVAQMLHELPLYSEDEFKQVIANLLTHLSEEEITWLVEVQLTKTWGNIASADEIRKALELYLPYLRHELNAIPEFREVISALTLERIDKRTEKIEQKTNKTYESVRRIETSLEKVLESREKKKNVEEPDFWYFPHTYGMQANFTGRKAEFKMLNDWLADDKYRLLVLRALGGFGKSALAWQWVNIHINPQENPKLIWWSFYESDASFNNFLTDTLEYLNIDIPQGQRSQVDEILKAMQRQKILFVLDGFERILRAYSGMNASYQGLVEPKREEKDSDCVNLNAEILFKNMCMMPGIKSKALMTTRMTPRFVEPQHKQFIQGCAEKELKEVNEDDAVIFLRAQGVQQGTDREINEACKTYGYHPLSLRLLAGRITNDFDDPGDIIVSQKIRIDGNLTQRQHHVLQVSYDILPADEQKLLSTIACFRSAIAHDTLKAIAENKNFLDSELHDLVERGLLLHDYRTKKFDLHPIVRHYAYDRFTDSERKKTHKDLAFHFIDVMVDVMPLPDTKAKTLEDLAPVIELYHHMVRAGNLDEACKLFYDRLHKTLFYQYGAYQLIVELIRALFLDGEDKPPSLKDESAQAWSLAFLGSTYTLSGQPRHVVPLFEMSIGFDEKHNDKVNLAIDLGNVAIQQLVIGALSAAERNLRRQIAMRPEIDDNYNEAVGHAELGRVLIYRGIWDEINDEFTSAIKLFELEHAIQYIGVVWAYRALRFLLLGRQTIDDRPSSVVHYQSSIQCAQRALELADEWQKITGRSNPNPRDYASGLWLLGAAYCANNELTLAEENLPKALTLCRQINMVYFEADILLDLARLRYAQGDFKDAQEKASEALMITERSGYVLQGADVNLFLAELALEGYKLESLKVLSDKDAAIHHAKEALRLATCDGPPYYYKVAYEEAERFLENLK